MAISETSNQYGERFAILNTKNIIVDE